MVVYKGKVTKIVTIQIPMDQTVCSPYYYSPNKLLVTSHAMKTLPYSLYFAPITFLLSFMVYY